MISILGPDGRYKATLDETADGIFIEFWRKAWNRDTGRIYFAAYDRDTLVAPFHVACNAIQTILTQLEYDNPDAYTTARPTKEVALR